MTMGGDGPGFGGLRLGGKRRRDGPETAQFGLETLFLWNIFLILLSKSILLFWKQYENSNFFWNILK
jgi:hypothetical protein